jgi:hypothetical protein
LKVATNVGTSEIYFLLGAKAVAQENAPLNFGVISVQSRKIVIPDKVAADIVKSCVRKVGASSINNS